MERKVVRCKSSGNGDRGARARAPGEWGDYISAELGVVVAAVGLGSGILDFT